MNCSISITWFTTCTSFQSLRTQLHALFNAITGPVQPQPALSLQQHHLGLSCSTSLSSIFIMMFHSGWQPRLQFRAGDYLQQHQGHDRGSRQSCSNNLVVKQPWMRQYSISASNGGNNKISSCTFCSWNCQKAKLNLLLKKAIHSSNGVCMARDDLQLPILVKDIIHLRWGEACYGLADWKKGPLHLGVCPTKITWRIRYYPILSYYNLTYE